MAAVLACGSRARHRSADPQARGGESTRARDIVENGRKGHWTVLDHWGAALSHRSAACLWGLLPAIDGPVEISVRGDGGRARRSGIWLHRSLSLPPADVTLHRGIPVTAAARTVADLRRSISTRPEGRGSISARELRRAVRQADVLGLSIGSPPERDRTRSDLERDFLRLCRRRRLPVPEVNVRIGRYLVDFLWPDRRLVVETDSYLYHRGEAAFEDDHRRDFDLRRLGYRVERLSGRQLDEEPQRIARWLAKELSRGAGMTMPRENDGRPAPP